LEKEHILSISYHPKERINESNFQLESFSINCYQYWYQHTAFQSISISIRLNSKMFMRNVFKLDNFQLSLLIGHFNSSLHWMRFGFLLWFRFLHLNMCTIEHKTCDILAAERLRLMVLDNRLIIESFQIFICILKW